MFNTDVFEDNFNFDGYQNDNYTWNSELIAAAEISNEREDESQITPAFEDQIVQYWQQNFSRSSVDEILLNHDRNFDWSADRLTAADTEFSPDFDRLTGEAIAESEDGQSESGDGQSSNPSKGQNEVKVASKPDLSGRGRPKDQTDASSHYAAPTPTAAPITSPDSVS